MLGEIQRKAWGLLLVLVFSTVWAESVEVEGVDMHIDDRATSAQSQKIEEAVQEIFAFIRNAIAVLEKLQEMTDSRPETPEEHTLIAVWNSSFGGPENVGKVLTDFRTMEERMREKGQISYEIGGEFCTKETTAFVIMAKTENGEIIPHGTALENRPAVIHLCPLYFQQGFLENQDALTHENSHLFLGKKDAHGGNQKDAYAQCASLPVLPQDLQYSCFPKLSIEQRLENADSYSRFAKYAWLYTQGRLPLVSPVQSI